MLEQRSLQDLQHQLSARRLALLVQVGRRLIETVDPAQLAAALFELIGTELRLDVLLDYDAPDTGALRPAGRGGSLRGAEQHPGGLAPLDAICADAACRRVVVHVSTDASAVPLQAIGLNFFACMPLMAGERSFGALGVGRRQSEPFSEEDLTFLQAVAADVALAKNRLQLAAAIVRLGATEADPVAREIFGSPEWEKIRDRSSDEPVAYADLIERLHPDDREHGLALLKAAIDSRDHGQAERRLQENEERLRLVQDVGQIGSIDWDLTTNEQVWSFEARAIFGIAPDAPVGPQILERLVHPDDLGGVMADIKASLDPAGPGRFAHEYRIVRPNGEIGWLQARGCIYFADHGTAREAVRCIIAIQDISRHKQADAALAEAYERLQLGMRVAGFGTYDRDVATGRVVFSPELLDIYGLSMDQPIADERLVQLLHPADRNRVLAARQEGLDPNGPGGVKLEFRIIRPDGGLRWLHLCSRTFFVGENQDRRAVRTIGAIQDITSRKLAEEELAASEERLRIAAGVAGFGTFDWNVVTGEQIWFPELRAIFGLPQDEPAVPETLERHIHPDDRARMAEAVAAALDPTGPGLLMQEHRIIRRDGEVRWVFHYGRSFFAGQGAEHRAVRMIGAVQDITTPKQAELALTASEERLRLAQDLGGVGSFDWNVAKDETEVSDSYRRIFGIPPDLAVTIGVFFQRLVHPDDVDRIKAAVDATIERGQVIDVEYRIIRPVDQQLRWIHAQAGVVRDQAGRAIRFAGIAQDITDRKRIQEREQLLMREVDHRGKNLLAVIQSVVQLTRAASTDEFVAAVKGRIQALARAHTLLAESRWEGAELTTLVCEELAPFMPGGGRVHVSGPEVELKSAAAQSMALVLHELATNAAKYGALSGPTGSIGVTWSIDVASGQLSLRWEERGGPPVVPPTRRGFGSLVLRSSIERQLGGTVHLRWRPEGLLCELTLPTKQLVPPTEPRAAPPTTAAAEPRDRTVANAKVLVVEDEALNALYLAETLDAAGCEVIGPAASVDEAFKLMHGQQLDAALLDIDLAGDRSFPIADALSEWGVPFAFFTGFTADILPERFRQVRTLSKPADEKAITKLVEGLVSSGSHRP